MRSQDPVSSRGRNATSGPFAVPASPSPPRSRPAPRGASGADAPTPQHAATRAPVVLPPPAVVAGSGVGAAPPRRADASAPRPVMPAEVAPTGSAVASGTGSSGAADPGSEMAVRCAFLTSRDARTARSFLCGVTNNSPFACRNFVRVSHGSMRGCLVASERPRACQPSRIHLLLRRRRRRRPPQLMQPRYRLHSPQCRVRGSLSGARATTTAPPMAAMAAAAAAPAPATSVPRARSPRRSHP